MCNVSSETMKLFIAMVIATVFSQIYSQQHRTAVKSTLVFQKAQCLLLLLDNDVGTVVLRTLDVCICGTCFNLISDTVLRQIRANYRLCLFIRSSQLLYSA